MITFRCRRWKNLPQDVVRKSLAGYFPQREKRAVQLYKNHFFRLAFNHQAREADNSPAARRTAECWRASVIITSSRST